MEVLAIIGGVALVVAALLDVVNTLITTTTARGRIWPTVLLYTTTWRSLRSVGQRFSPERRERLYRVFAPVSVIAMLLTWVTLQIVGFGLIWWGLGGIDGAATMVDSVYYSGVVYFTLGFGEIVPAETVPRVGALIEAFAGVLTTALVIGYLPALYSAYSEREQKLLTLDDGTEDRITPTNLVMARCPDGNVRDLDSFFEGWEAWVTHVMETHTTFRMLVLFRSQHTGQHWITALGVVLDAALHVEMTRDGQGRAAYWFLRRATHLLHLQTEGLDLSAKRAELDANYGEDGQSRFFGPLYDAMTTHGFDLVPADEAYERTQLLRRNYDAQLEILIDMLDAPRGFWGHTIGHQREAAHFIVPE